MAISLQGDVEQLLAGAFLALGAAAALARRVTGTEYACAPCTVQRYA